MNRETGERVNVEELVRFATDELHLDYFFWGTQEPQLTAEIYPYLQALPCSNDCSQEERVRFLPDGRGLVYMGGLTTTQDFYLLDLGTMKSRRLTRFEDPANMRTFDITSDGTEIVFDRLSLGSDLVLIDLENQ